MNFAVYRNGKIGYPCQHDVSEGVALMVVHPDRNNYYTPDGFIFPLNGTGPCVSSVISGKFPMMDHPKASFSSSALMVTRVGGICQVDVFKSGDRDSWALDFHTLPEGMECSYVLANSLNTRHLLSAAMAAWKDEEKFQKDIDSFAVGSDRKLTWISVEDIVKRINQLFPV